MIDDDWSEGDFIAGDTNRTRRLPVHPGFLVVPALLGLLVVLVLSLRHVLDDHTASSLASQWTAAQSADNQRLALENVLSPFPSPSLAASANPGVAMGDLARLAGGEKSDLARLRMNLTHPWPFDHSGAQLRAAMEAALEGRQAYLVQLSAYDLRLAEHPSLAGGPLLGAAAARAQQEVVRLLSDRGVSQTRAAADYRLSFRPTPLARRLGGSDRLILAGVLPPRLVDLSTGTVANLTAAGLGAYPDQFRSVLTVGDAVVGITSEGTAVAFLPGPDPQVHALGLANEVFASASPGAVWLFRGGIGATQLVLVSLNGTSQGATVALPFEDPVLAVTPDGVLVDVASPMPGSSSALEVWGLSRRTWVDDLGPMAQFVAAAGNIVAWTTPTGELDTDDLESGARHTIQPPAGTDGFLAGGGAISPDGTRLAAFLELGGSPYGFLSAAIDQLVTVDLGSGALSLVAGSEVVASSSHAAACWDRSGRRVYFSGDFGSLASLDLRTESVHDLDYAPVQQCTVLPDQSDDGGIG